MGVVMGLVVGLFLLWGSTIFGLMAVESNLKREIRELEEALRKKGVV